MNTINPPIPVLMYHEISDDSFAKTGCHFQTPLYDISVSMFENQIKVLADNNYTSLCFDDTLEISGNGKYIIITFDDGLKGNYQYALPILKKYGFRGVFFVAVDLIGTKRFMTWHELGDLKQQQMSIQSHTLSHRPLQTLNRKNIRRELKESKKILESKLNSQISSISFPHGSYNKQIINMALDEGYITLCCSFPNEIYLSDFKRNPRLIGRIPMTNKLTLEQFISILEYSKLAMLKLKIPKLAKNIIKKSIGINNYRIFYRKIFGIKNPHKLTD